MLTMLFLPLNEISFRGPGVGCPKGMTKEDPKESPGSSPPQTHRSREEMGWGAGDSTIEFWGNIYLFSNRYISIYIYVLCSIYIYLQIYVFKSINMYIYIYISMYFLKKYIYTYKCVYLFSNRYISIYLYIM